MLSRRIAGATGPREGAAADLLKAALPRTGHGALTERALVKLGRPKHGPEWHIQRTLKEFLAVRGWLVESTHGNAFQQGFPDLFIARPGDGTRWIDCKVPSGARLTQAQRQKWPEWELAGVGIWILTAADQEQYDLLFGPPNWRQFFRQDARRRRVPNVETLLAECRYE